MKNLNFLFELGGPLAFALLLGVQLFGGQAEPDSTPTSTSAPSILPDFSFSSEYTFPVSGYGTDDIISGFGDARGKTRKHLGVDIKAPRHTKIVAIRSGKVERIKEGGNAGKSLYLRGDDGRLYFYAHLEDWLIKEGDLVDQGDAIATVGDSGNAKGTTPHLHFEVMEGKGKTRKSIDPAEILDAHF